MVGSFTTILIHKMITQIVALPRKEMIKLLPLMDSTAWVISIGDPGDESICDGRNPERTLELRFEDDDPEVWSPTHVSLQCSTYFTQELAEETLGFLRKLRAEPDVDHNVLFINCEMGSSRSVAVARFAQQLFGTPESYVNVGEYPSPNRWVMKLLHIVARA